MFCVHYLFFVTLYTQLQAGLSTIVQSVDGEKCVTVQERPNS